MEKLYKKSEVDHLNDENVVEEFLKLCRARSRVVVAKMKEEADLKLKHKKPKNRVENTPTRKKRKVPDIKPEVGSGDQPMIQVKKESEG